MKNSFKYFIDDYCGPEEDYYELKTNWGINELEYIAEEAAKDHFYNNDGWESSWPLTFVILDENLNKLGQFIVDMEAVPQFWATKVVSESS